MGTTLHVLVERVFRTTILDTNLADWLDRVRRDNNLVGKVESTYDFLGNVTKVRGWIDREATQLGPLKPATMEGTRFLREANAFLESSKKTKGRFLVKIKLKAGEYIVSEATRIVEVIQAPNAEEALEIFLAKYPNGALLGSYILWAALDVAQYERRPVE